MENEIWKDIIGYEGYYQVSNFGRVKSLITGTIRKHGDNGAGYKFVPLSKNGKVTNKYIHRLVCGHFAENPLNKATVNHKDGVKSNNNVNNLEWATQSENSQHGFDTGLINQKSGSENTNSIPVLKYSLSGKFICEYGSITIASEQNKICTSNIIANCRMITNRAGSFQWRYKHDYKKEVFPIQLKKGNGEIKVEQYTKDGKYISTFDSQTEAENSTGIKRGGISSCCRGELKTSGGYIWRLIK